VSFRAAKTAWNPPRKNDERSTAGDSSPCYAGSE